jgi:hypothetical protein
MKATPIDELRKPHPDQGRIDAEAVRLLLATVPVGYAKKVRKSGARGIGTSDHIPLDPLLPRR